MHVSSGMGCPRADGELVLVDTDTGRELACTTCDHREPIDERDFLDATDLADHTDTAVLVDRYVMVDQFSAALAEGLTAYLGLRPGWFDQCRDGRNVSFDTSRNSCQSLVGLARAIEFFRAHRVAYREYLELRHIPPYPDAGPPPAPVTMRDALTNLDGAAATALALVTTDSRWEPQTQTPVSRDTV
ncbi:hypothetical protein AB0C34_17250 [Nocardia sp. NPDC049220]|uniref:hypothetical protein n=1 Tax=Nocardia sp. NPDC049220 TaxID=3155273 RepID=UPI0033E303C8